MESSGNVHVDYLGLLARSVEGFDSSLQHFAIIATENVRHRREIAKAIRTCHARSKPAGKFALMFMVSSLIKKVGRPYVEAFGSRLPYLFWRTYKLADRRNRELLRSLRSLLDGAVPKGVLENIDVLLAAVDAGTRNKQRAAVASARRHPD